MDVPAFDIRPAFPCDLDRLSGLIRERYGCERVPFFEDCVVLLYGNETTHIGLCAVAHGRVVASFKRHSDGSESAHLTLAGVIMAAPYISRRIVRIKRSAEPYIRTGKNVMATSVTYADPRIEPGSDAIVMLGYGRIIATGTARMSGGQMIESDRGMAIKVKAVDRGDESPRMLPSDWEKVTEANGEVIRRRVAASVRFLRGKIGGTDAVISALSLHPSLRDGG